MLGLIQHAAHTAGVGRDGRARVPVEVVQQQARSDQRVSRRHGAARGLECLPEPLLGGNFRRPALGLQPGLDRGEVEPGAVAVPPTVWVPKTYATRRYS